MVTKNILREGNHMAKDSKNSNDGNQLIAWEEKSFEFEGIEHLRISYTLTSNNDGLHDVYVYGTDNEGKVQAEFLNSHPQILTAFINGLGYNITQKQLRKSSKENNGESKGALYFDNEKEYQAFIQELHGDPSCERKKQLAQAKHFIQKHQDLLKDFECKATGQFEMKVDKTSWLTSQLLSWTKLMPNDIGEEAKIHKYIFLPLIKQTIKQENIHTTGRYAVKMVDDPDKRSPEVRMVADQISKQIERNDVFEDKSIKARALFAISPETDLYTFFSKLYGNQAKMDQALKAAGWFKPGEEAHENVKIDDFCDSYWAIPEWEDCVEDTLRKAFPQGFYDKVKITIKAQ